MIHDDNPPFVVITSLRFGTIKRGTGKKAKKTTGIVIQLSGSLNPTQAKSLAPFHLLSGKVKKGHTTYSKPVPLSSAIYDPSAHTMSLVPKRKLNTSQPEQFKITASSLMDSLGRPIDGNHDGQPGGDFVADLSKKRVTILSAIQARAMPKRLTTTVDAAIHALAVAHHPMVLNRHVRDSGS